MTIYATVCNTTYYFFIRSRMEGDVVYCSQNAMFVLPRKMLKILYQLCTWSTSVRNAAYITPVYCMLLLPKYWEHIYYKYKENCNFIGNRDHINKK